jgi:hypothetical protein
MVQKINQIIGKTEKENLPSTSSQSWAIEIKKTFGDKVDFLKSFSPDKQKVICLNLEDCYNGKYPTLVRLKETYGNDVILSWLMIQINDLSEYTSTKKIDIRQIEELAASILVSYRYMNIAQIMLFFLRFKSGEYGKFYGTVDALVIADAFSSFCLTRAREVSDFETIENRRIEKIKKEWQEKYCVSREKYEELKIKAKNGDQESIRFLHLKPNE